jgi:putative transposase
VRREAGRWFCSFTHGVRRADLPRTRPDVVIGVDPGITHLTVPSSPIPGVSDRDGFVSNPQHLGRAQRDLRLRRGGSAAVPAQTGPSKRWEKANRARNTTHHRLTNLRRDGLHKLTTCPTATIGTVVVEDLTATPRPTSNTRSPRVAAAR